MNNGSTESTESTGTALSDQQTVFRESSLFPWWSLVALGGGSILFGSVILVWPDVSLRVMAVLAGLWLLSSGIVRIVAAFMPARGPGRQLLSGVVGVILVLCGIVCLRDLAAAMVVLSLVVIVTWMLSGIAEIVLSAEATGSGRVWWRALGVVSIMIAVVFLFVPKLSLLSLVLITGLGAIFTGLVQVVLGLRLRRPAT
jgi:uncharacterized membrane protein HdeD (DUF308 family)